ncbi:hypothetical protein GOV10_06425 [Candidatus Woesearchaeota archaeon]|nr:hypothetical protein [Candidatus Woesearchaeota archaeon]
MAVFVLGATVILAIGVVLLFFLPIGIGGFTVVFKLIALMNTPILGDSIPIWVVFMVFLGLLIILKKSNRRVAIAPAY